jgi:hypothetical protein
MGPRQGRRYPSGNGKNGERAAILDKRRLLAELIIAVSGCGRYLSLDAAMHKLAVAFFYACVILSMSVTAHAVARGGMAEAEFQNVYLKALCVTLGLIRVVREAPGKER